MKVSALLFVAACVTACTNLEHVRPPENCSRPGVGSGRQGPECAIAKTILRRLGHDPSRYQFYISSDDIELSWYATQVMGGTIEPRDLVAAAPSGRHSVVVAFADNVMLDGIAVNDLHRYLVLLDAVSLAPFSILYLPIGRMEFSAVSAPGR